MAKREACGTLPEELALRIAQYSERNLRRALLMLEACRVQQYPFTATQEVSESFFVQALVSAPPPRYLPTALFPYLQVKVADWEDYISKLANQLVQEQSPQQLVLAREMLYELLTNCIPPDVILKVLVRELLTKLDDQLKHEVVYWAAFYEHRVQIGSKEIFHLEAFIAKFMSLVSICAMTR